MTTADAAYLRSDNAARLHAHVVQCRPHRSRPDRPSIATRECHNNRMDIRGSNHQNAQCILGPLTRGSREYLQRHQQRKQIQLPNEDDQEAIVDFLGQPSPEDELEEEEKVGGDGEQIGLEDIPA